MTKAAICATCGNPAVGGTIFCSKCGATLRPEIPLTRSVPQEAISGGRESRERSPGLWVIVAGVVILNLWYDYYHPLGIIFDVIIGAIILTAYAKKP